MMIVENMLQKDPTWLHELCDFFFFFFFFSLCVCVCVCVCDCVKKAESQRQWTV